VNHQNPKHPQAILLQAWIFSSPRLFLYWSYFWNSNLQIQLLLLFVGCGKKDLGFWLVFCEENKWGRWRSKVVGERGELVMKMREIIRIWWQARIVRNWGLRNTVYTTHWWMIIMANLCNWHKQN
jgi:hypothetical protein